MTIEPEEPEYFSAKDIVRSFFGSLFFGFAFIFSKALIDLSITLDKIHVLLILVSTFLILTFEIYFIGYQRVKDTERRPFWEFWLKRFSTFYIITVLVSLYLVYIYNFQIYLATYMEIIKLIVAVSLPCATGAAIADLLKKY